MNQSRKYNVISQRFITEYNDIPFVKSHFESRLKYDVHIEVFDTDYISFFFFKNFDLRDLYAIYIVDKKEVSNYSNLNLISKHSYLNKDIFVMRVDFNFFMKIDYNNRNELSGPIFFKSSSLEELNLEEILNKCLYEKEIIIGNFKKNIVKLDVLKLLNNTKVSNVIKFYIDLSEAYLEEVLNLKDNILNINEDYISKVEISLEK
ncbi:hypothetical protein [Flavobacterium sp. HJSW_4]|uniref:hypothetical protein n=1 Tax=Flavobacterium sp. HJSW_4 TaxID=3344660 RepID=UPI0035F4DC20